MIYVRYHDRTGNNLFQWAFARVLSELTGVPMTAPALPLFPETDLPQTPWPVTGIKHCRLAATGRDQLEDWTARVLDGDTIVSGWPFNVDFFAGHRALLTALLRPAGGEFYAAQADDVVLHLRYADFAQYRSNHYDVEVFARVLARLNYSRCLIVTDSAELPAVSRLIKHHRGLVVSKDVAHDYRTLWNARRLILSPSTFSWWAGWTGGAQELYQPFQTGMWHLRLGHNLNWSGSGVRLFNERGELL